MADSGERKMDRCFAAHQEEGSALVEMAFILPVMLLIAFGIFDYAFWIQKSMLLQEAANAGAAYGAIPGQSSSHSGMKGVAYYNATGSTSGAPGYTASATDFYVCTPGGTQVTSSASCPLGAPFHYVQVTIGITPAAAALKYPLVPSSLSLSATATYRVESLL